MEPAIRAMILGDAGGTEMAGWPGQAEPSRPARVMSFGYDGDGGLGDRLVEAVLIGAKTATSWLVIEHLSGDPLPRAGERLPLVGSTGRRRGTVQTTRVTCIALSDVVSHPGPADQPPADQPPASGGTTMCLTPLLRYRSIESPIGLLTLAGQGDVLTNLVLAGGAHPPSDRSRWVEDTAAFLDVVAQLHEHFAGKRTGFEVALRLEGTSFQQRVWDALREIPYGETRSYGEIARQIGQPRAARAVGLANARNPIPIIIPCHRVIGANGTLTGYAGGLETKRALLDLERARHPGPPRRRCALGTTTTGAGAWSRDVQVADFEGFRSGA